MYHLDCIPEFELYNAASSHNTMPENTKNNNNNNTFEHENVLNFCREKLQQARLSANANL